MADLDIEMDIDIGTLEDDMAIAETDDTPELNAVVSLANKLSISQILTPGSA